MEIIEDIGTMFKMSSLKIAAKDFMTAVMSDQSVANVQKLKY